MKRAILILVACCLWAGSTAAQDTTPPAAITDLTVETGKSTAVLYWHDTGDDGTSGTATTYEIRRSLSPISEGNLGDLVASGTPAGGNGTSECVDLANQTCNMPFYWAVFLLDEADNRSAVGNVVQRSTLSCSSQEEVICFNLLREGVGSGRNAAQGQALEAASVGSWA